MKPIALPVVLLSFAVLSSPAASSAELAAISAVRLGHDGQYSITEVPLPGEYAVAVGGINDWGAVVGTTISGNYSVAFLRNRKGSQEFARLSRWDILEIRGINRREQIVGSITEADNRAMLWHDGRALDLGSLGGTNSGATAINDRGDIVGTSTVAGETSWHPFLYRKGVMVDLGVFGGTDAYAYAINNKRQVAIEHQDSSGSRLAIYHNGNFRIVGAIGAWTAGLAINESGHVAGICQGADNGRSHAFYYNGHSLIDLHVPGATYSECKSINNRDQIVGTWYIEALAGRTSGGFLYSRGRHKDVSELLPPGSGWTILTADHINDAGQIVGVGMYNHARKFYVLTPSKHRGKE